MKADMHIHSYYSDGRISPAYIAETCAKNGLQFAVLTDHDNTNGCAEFAAECAKRGVKCVSGLEISAYLGDIKIHTLGYNIDTGCAAFRQFEKFVYEGSRVRTEDVLSKLKKIGFCISMQEVEEQKYCDNSPYHIMNVSFAAVKKGMAPSAGEFYITYLAPGKPAFSNLARPTPEYALDVIRSSGGISSLAHPGRIAMNEDEKITLIESMVTHGLNGIEAVYSGHTMVETAYYKGVAEKYSLLVTGGSDTHYSTGNRSIGTPDFYPSQELLSALEFI